ncbi:hypothetical protein Bca52824_070651 [Brassica carinata]|uniref:RRM domain-containing protein n=1 Tax=Brassica carinata TaxID=52824 RepID=A0A8X7Q5D0_BRACI|nr:hypothetical protein Bca52824_070651 [Brassica carinata]
MAFLSKLGNILKQTNAHVSSSSPSLFQTIRCMSSSKLFIGGMEYGMNEDSLREAFSKYGEVVETRVILDRETGRSRGLDLSHSPLQRLPLVLSRLWTARISMAGL